MRLARSWSPTLAVLLLVVACGSETAAPEPRAEESPSAATPSTSVATPTAMPTSIPVPDGPVTTGYAATVLDDGEGAQLCLGGVALSLPPQCGGPKLIGWDWSDHEGDYQDVSGTKWGEFAITGTFDGEDLTPTDAVPADEFDAPEFEDVSDFSTPCPEPDGGWAVPTDADNTHMAMDRAFRRASQLEGYADSWVDNSRDERTPEQMDHDAASGADDVSLMIVNVRVTGDVVAAEAELREVWSGALCVTAAEHTDRELRRIQHRMHDLPGLLSSGSGDQQVAIGVVFDDGSIQAWLDSEYGPGMVLVDSALKQVE